MPARFPKEDRMGLPTGNSQVWGPWVKTARELGLNGRKNRQDKKKYNAFIREYMAQLAPSLLNTEKRAGQRRRKSNRVQS